MKDYIIFLDIDGTLWDNKHAGLEIPVMMHDTLNPESVEALNNLVEGLKGMDYNPIIVVTSQRRHDWDDCQYFLFDQGITDAVPMYRLPSGNLTRGERISLLLRDHHKGKDISYGYRHYGLLDKLHLDYANKCTDYVVIDDMSDIVNNIPKSNKIITNLYNQSLTKKQVEEYLNKLSKEEETGDDFEK